MIEYKELRQTGWEDFDEAISTIRSLKEGYDGRPRDNTREYIMSDISDLRKSIEALNARKDNISEEERKPIEDLIIGAENLIRELEQKI